MLNDTSLSFSPLSSVFWNLSGSFLWNQLITPCSRLLQSSHLLMSLPVRQYTEQKLTNVQTKVKKNHVISPSRSLHNLVLPFTYTLNGLFSLFLHLQILPIFFYTLSLCVYCLSDLNYDFLFPAFITIHLYAHLQNITLFYVSQRTFTRIISLFSSDTK